MSDTGADDRPKKERSPSYPFIPLKKAEDRAKQFWERHRREAARVPTIAATWGYEPKSSGFMQTIAALKQYGLLEDLGRGEDRKIQLSELGRRLVADQRPGAREAALKEAAMRPSLFQEYRRWIIDPPSDAHRLSDLELDRGFGEAAAKLFLRAFDETVAYAGLADDDSLSSPLHEGEGASDPMVSANQTEIATEAPPAEFPPAVGTDLVRGPVRLPLAQRLKVEVTLGSLKVSATLLEASEVDKLVQVLQANRVLLPEEEAEAKLN